MNFKTVSLLLFMLPLLACGVKSDPVPPAGTALPSYVDKFLDKEQADKDKKDKVDEQE